jgi:hypothetical protein
MYPKFTCSDCTVTTLPTFKWLPFAQQAGNPFRHNQTLDNQHNELSLLSRGLIPRLNVHIDTQIKMRCYTLNFFRFVWWTALYIFCRGGLVTAAWCLPPGRSIYKVRPHLQTFVERQTARTKTTHNGKWKAPSWGRVHWDFLMNRGALCLLVRRGH